MKLQGCQKQSPGGQAQLGRGGGEGANNSRIKGTGKFLT